MSELLVRLEILKCKDCGRLVLATANAAGNSGTRLSHHKCSGMWTTVLSETYPLADIENEAFDPPKGLHAPETTSTGESSTVLRKEESHE